MAACGSNPSGSDVSSNVCGFLQTWLAYMDIKYLFEREGKFLKIQMIWKVASEREAGAVGTPDYSGAPT